MSNTDEVLSVLARADSDRIKAFADRLIPEFDDLCVRRSRTGLVMLPMRDTAKGQVFHLGEVLVSEAHIQNGTAEGYGMRCGHDLEAAMAMAVVDLALSLGIEVSACREFCETETRRLRDLDDVTLRNVAATRVSMETF